MKGSVMPTARQRRPRLTDEQTARRVLDAALAMLADGGINVGLDNLRFEDVIRAADVSRTSAYRRWPTRDAFVEDVLVELARDSDLLEVGSSIAARVSAAATALGPATATEAGRRDLLVELLRISLQAEVEAMAASAQFRTNLALRGAFLGVRSPELRTEVVTALTAGEHRATARAAALLSRVVALCGHRLAPPLTGPEGFEVVGRSVAAASIGFVLTALAEPAIVTGTHLMAAYGSTRSGEWSVPTLALAGTVMVHVEPDPDAVALPPDELASAVTTLVDTVWAADV
jgi:AcrR family transcriptional regulator